MKDRSGYTDEQWNALWVRWERMRDLPWRKLDRALSDLKAVIFEPIIPVVARLSRWLDK